MIVRRDFQILYKIIFTGRDIEFFYSNFFGFLGILKAKYVRIVPIITVYDLYFKSGTRQNS